MSTCNNNPPTNTELLKELAKQGKYRFPADNYQPREYVRDERGWRRAQPKLNGGAR